MSKELDALVVEKFHGTRDSGLIDVVINRGRARQRRAYPLGATNRVLPINFKERDRLLAVLDADGLARH